MLRIDWRNFLFLKLVLAMNNGIYSTVTNYDGFIVRRDAVVFIAKPDVLEHDDYRRSTLYTCANGDWGHQAIPFMVQSSLVVAYDDSKTPFKIFSIGEMSGIMEIYWPMGLKIEREYLPGATSERGLLHLKQIREVDGKILVVGISSQIFMRDDSGWHVFNQGIEPPQLKVEDSKKGLTTQELGDWEGHLLDLHSIDGCSIGSLYAVGSKGTIIYRGDGTWRRLPKLTNAYLRRVRVISPDVVFIVGDEGVLLKGNSESGFSFVDTGIKDDILGVEWFNGKLYLGAGTTGVYVYDGTSVSKVPGLALSECHTLHSGSGQLLAVGNKDSYLTDDAIQWKLLRNPNNE